jgi:hypothetical protein
VRGGDFSLRKRLTKIKEYTEKRACFSTEKKEGIKKAPGEGAF